MDLQAAFQPHLAHAGSTIVVVIDLQERLLPLIHEGETVVRNSVRLMKMADIFGAPVILTEQYPLGLGASAPEVKDTFAALTTAKHFITKDSFSCTLEPAFNEQVSEIAGRMNERPVDVVVAGIESHICVWQTVIGLLQQEYSVRVCHDCVGSRDKQNKKWALQSMLAMGAIITSSESVAFEWARDKNHPQFRALNKLMKS